MRKIWHSIADVFSVRRKSRKIPISVVVNTDNRARTLAKTLEGLRGQTYQEFEVIVVTGPSADATDNLLYQYAADIKTAPCPERKIGLSRNIGIEMASGDIVAFIDDDAVPERTWLEKISSVYKDPSVAGVGGQVFDVPLDRIEWRICTSTRTGEVSTNADPPADAYVRVGADPFLYLAGCNMSFRKSDLVSIGGFNEAFVFGYEDVEVCCRIIDGGRRIALLEDAIVFHERASNSIRDDGQVVRDIYPIFYARTVFALQCCSKEASIQDLLSRIAESASHWRNAARSQLDQGIFTPLDYERFVGRIDCAISDGMAMGLRPRFFRTFG